MGNVTAKQLRTKLDGASGPTSASVFLHQAEGRKSSSGSSESSSQDFIDAESEFHSSTDDEQDLEDLISRTHEELLNRTHEDAFMKAVLSFCAHMGGRMDNLDNARLYDEFCSYAAAHRPKEDARGVLQKDRRPSSIHPPFRPAQFASPAPVPTEATPSRSVQRLL